MLQKLITYWDIGNDYHAVEIFEKDGRRAFHFLKANRKNNELHIGQEDTFFELSQLKVHLQKNIPLFLVVNTQKVLHKFIEGAMDMDAETLLQKAFPNLDLQNFHYSLSEFNGSVYMAIAQKQLINEIRGDFTDQGIQVSGLSMGLAPLAIILDGLEKKTVHTNIGIIKAEEKQIVPPIGTTPVAPNQAYKVQDLTVSGRSLTAFGEIVSQLTNHTVISSLVEVNSALRQNFRHERRLRLMLGPTLGLLVLLLTINFLFFQHYFDRFELLQESIAFDDSKKEELATLRALVTEKEKKVDMISSNSQNHVTLLLDEIAATVPPSVSLDQMVYQPLKGTVREGKEIEFHELQLKILGRSNNSTLYYGWLKTLEKFDWAYSIETEQYNYINDRTSGFVIKITFQ